jgi:hypothetical protein
MVMGKTRYRSFLSLVLSRLGGGTPFGFMVTGKTRYRSFLSLVLSRWVAPPL